MSLFVFTREVGIEDRSVRQTAVVYARNATQAETLLETEVAAIGAVVSRSALADADSAYLADGSWTVEEIMLSDPRMVMLSLTR